MERLTFDGNFCDIAQCRELPCRHDGECSAKRVWERLKEYENTIWTPEMLRKLNENAGKMWDFAQAVENMSIGRLKELAEADKDGRLVVQPCKVGDTVWLTRGFYAVYKEPIAVTVTAIRFSGDTCTIITDQRRFSASAIGETVFLSLAEAEKAMAEMGSMEARRYDT